MLLFKGAPNEKVTSCINEVSSDWVLYIGGFVDVFNTILFLFLFIYPICNSYKLSGDNNAYKKRFKSVIWYNVTLSTLCTIASSTHLFLLPSFPEYLRLFEQADMTINQTLVFFMLASNRNYVKKKFNQYCACLCCNDNNKDKKSNAHKKPGYHKKVDSKMSIASLSTTTVTTGTAPNRSMAVQHSMNTIQEIQDDAYVSADHAQSPAADSMPAGHIVPFSMSSVHAVPLSTTFE